MKWKPGINLWLSPEMSVMLPAIDAAHADAGIARDAIVTSANDSQHKSQSLHYVGCALDLRTRDLTTEQIAKLAEALKKRLGPKFDVVVEKDHIHVEFDPE